MAAEISIENVEELLLNFHLEVYPDILQKFWGYKSLRSIFPTVSAVKDEVVFTEADVSEMAQPYQFQWTPKGDLKLIPEKYQVRYVKADREIDPNSLRQTYLAGWLPGSIPAEHEIVRKFYDAMVKRFARDIDNALINGTYAAPTSGTAGAALAMLDGLATITKGFITKKQITPITDAGTIDDTTAAVTLRKMWSKIPAQFRYSPDLRCYVFDNVMDMYRSSFRAEFGQDTDFAMTRQMKIYDTDCPIVTLPYGGESKMVIFTMEGNITLIENDPQDVLRFDVQKEKRQFNFMMDSAAGIGYKIVGEAENPDNQYVWTNDPTTWVAEEEEEGGGVGA